MNGGAERDARHLVVGLGLLAAVLLVTACSGPGRGPETDPATARAEAEAGRRLHPTEPYWPYRQAELATNAAPALAHLDTALALDADYAPAIALLSKLQYESGRHAQAVTLLRDHLRRQPAADDALRAALALHLDALGAWEEADSVLADCSDQSAPAAGVRTYLGLQGDDARTAADAAERALAVDPGSAANHNNQGIALLYAGRPDEARQAFLDALERDDDLPGALYNLAIVETFYFYDTEAGRRWFARYRELATDDPDGLAESLGFALTTASREDQP
jgi:tetratricopeptide (TPR) repeat protein